MSNFKYVFVAVITVLLAGTPSVGLSATTTVFQDNFESASAAVSAFPTIGQSAPPTASVGQWSQLMQQDNNGSITYGIQVTTASNPGPVSGTGQKYLGVRRVAYAWAVGTFTIGCNKGLTVDFDMYVPDGNTANSGYPWDCPEFSIESGPTYSGYDIVANAFFSNGNISNYNGTSWATQAPSYSTHQWNHFEYTFDFTAHTYNLSINSTATLSGMPFAIPSATSAQCMIFYAGARGATFYLDNVTVTADVNVPPANTLTFDSDKIMYLNGQKFFPIGIYNTGDDPGYISDAKQYGFNTIQCYCEQYPLSWMSDIMNLSANNGLYVVLGVENKTASGTAFGASGQVLDFSNNMSAKQTLINQTVDTFRNCTNLLGFYCGDEPTDNGINASGWGQGADYLRSRDGNLTRVFICCDRQSELNSTSTYAAKSNVLMEDWYASFTSSSGSKNGLQGMLNYLSTAKTSSIGGVGVVTQAFPWPTFLPTESQLRCQAYLGICGGAKAYFAYAMQNSTWHLYDSANVALQNAHIRLNAQLAKLSPVWLTSSSYDIGTTTSSTDVKTYSRNVNGAVYVTAVSENESTTHNGVTLTMGSPAWTPKRLWAIGETRTCTVNASKQFTDNFAPYADHQYTSSHSAMHVIDSNGVLWRSLSEGPVGWEPMASMYNFSSVWQYFTSQNTDVEPLGSGDVDGDGYDDIVVIHDNGRIDALMMGPTGLTGIRTLGNPKQDWGWYFSSVDNAVLPLGVGDINGDGHADIVTIDYLGNIRALCTDGNSITQLLTLGNIKQSWGWYFSAQDTAVKPLGIADINGDGYADIIVILDTGEIRALTTNGSSITGSIVLGNPYSWWGWWLGAGWPHQVVPCKTGDVNGDGYADICTVAPDGTCKAVTTNGSAIWNEQTITSPSSLFNSTTSSKLKSLDIPFGWGWLNTDITCSYALAGDLNNDCKVDFGDVNMFVGQWLNSCDSSTWCYNADLNHSDRVDFSDFAALAENWLVDCSVTPVSSACVPK